VIGHNCQALRVLTFRLLFRITRITILKKGVKNEQSNSPVVLSPHRTPMRNRRMGWVLCWGSLGTREQTQQANHYQLVAPVRNFTNPVPDTRSMITSITSHREHNKMRTTVTIGSEQYHSSLLLRNGRTKRKQKRNERKKIRFSFLHMILNSS
jgi:hypothetical protein